MASFTDNPQIGFNPYIQQLPVEAMAQVGMQKQRLYDEGIQKIQGNIENIAGLDVIRDVDKQYLQSKLNQLGTKLKSVAAGDFSNYQLTNSVGGMVTGIAKDPLIQNGVRSTMKVRKEQALMEEAEKAGKSSIQNREWFNENLNNWLNNSDIKTPYTGKYTQYIDIDKKLREIAEKVHETDNAIDIPYQRDGRGNILYFSQDSKTKQITASTDSSTGGQPRIDDAMLSIKTKGRPAEKILANFYDSLNADDQNQLKIDSWYHYKGADRNKFVNDATKNYNENKKLLSDSIVDMNLQLITSPLSAAQKGQIQAKINYTNDQLSKGILEKELQQQIEEIDNSSDIEGYKYKIYTQKYLTSLAKDISYQSIQQEYKSNPYFQADMEKRRLEFSYDNANREQRNFEANLGLQRDKFEWDKWASQRDYDFKVNQENLKTPMSPAGYPGKISPDVPVPTLEKLEQEIKAIIGDPKTNTPGAIDLLNADVPELSGLTTPGAKKAYLDLLSRKYAQNPKGVYTTDPDVKEYLGRRYKLENEALSLQTTWDIVNNKSKKYNEEIENRLESLPPVTIGNKQYSARDLYEMKAGYEDAVNPDMMRQARYIARGIVGAGYGVAEGLGIIDKSKIPPNEKEQAIQNYVSKFKGTNKEELANALISDNFYNPIKGAMNRVYDDNKEKVGKLYTDKLQFQAAELSKHVPNFQPTKFTLDLENNKLDKSSVTSIIGQAILNYNEGGVDVDSNKDFDPEIIKAIEKDPNAKYVVVKNMDDSANLIMMSGSIQQTIPIKQEDFPQEFARYARTNPITEIKRKINSSVNKTTNASGGNKEKDAVTAYLRGDELPGFRGTEYASIVRMDIEGKSTNKGDENDLYKLRMYVNVDGIWKTDLITQDKYLTDKTLITDGLMLIGPATVDEFLKRNK